MSTYYYLCDKGKYYERKLTTISSVDAVYTCHYGGTLLEQGGGVGGVSPHTAGFCLLFFLGPYALGGMPVGRATVTAVLLTNSFEQIGGGRGGCSGYGNRAKCFQSTRTRTQMRERIVLSSVHNNLPVQRSRPSILHTLSRLLRTIPS